MLQYSYKVKIIQASQTGNAKYLIDMHRVRAKIFKERMGWDVSINDMGLEIDNYDLPETIYLLSINDDDKVVGIWRFLLGTEPSMIRDLWPHYLPSLPIPKSNTICETSRFGVYCDSDSNSERHSQVNHATAEMIVGLIDVCMMCGIPDMYTLYNVKIKRLLERIGFKPYATSEVIDLEGVPTVTAHFKMDAALKSAIQLKTGIRSNLSAKDLPPLLMERFLYENVEIKERVHA